MAAARQILFGFPIGNATGWEICGLNICLHLLRRGVTPVPIFEPRWSGMTEGHRAILHPLEGLYRQWVEAVRKADGRGIKANLDMVVGLTNDLGSSSASIQVEARHTFGLVFLELAYLNARAISRGRRYSKIITASQWNARVLREWGLDRVVCIPQGVDSEFFHPGPKSGRYAGRFVVYSGGKLEYRKGQDLVVAAMREFEARHPESLLMFAWQNYLPELMTEIATCGLVKGHPAAANESTDFGSWLKSNGLKQFVDLGPLYNSQVPALIRDADVGLFPNRCEGGTNQVAMECMACGVPVILSANTGHLDLIDEQRCFVLRDQKPVRPTLQYPTTRLWGESSVEEILNNLEQVWSDRQEAGRRAAKAVEFMRNMNWGNLVDRLLTEMGNA